MLEGDLGDFTLADVLRLLAFTSKTGRLRLRRGPVAAHVTLRDGRLLEATADDRRLTVTRRLAGAGAVDERALAGVLDRTTGRTSDGEVLATLVAEGDVDRDAVADAAVAIAVDALVELMRWPQGSFSFEATDDLGPLAELLGTGRDVDRAIDDAEHRLSKWRDLGEIDDPLRLAVPTEPRDLNITADAWQVLAWVDGQRTIRDLAELTGHSEVSVRERIGELVDAGVVALGARVTNDLDATLAKLSDVERFDAVSSARAEPAATRPSERPAARPATTTGRDPDSAALGGAKGGEDMPAPPVAVPRPARVTTPAAAPEAGRRIGQDLRRALDVLEELQAFAADPATDAGADRTGASDPAASTSDAAGARHTAARAAPGAPPTAPTPPPTAAAPAQRPSASPRPDAPTSRRLQLDDRIDEELVARLVRGVEGL